MHLFPRLAVCLLIVLYGGIASAAPAGLERIREQIEQGRIAPAAAQVDAYLARHPRNRRARFLRGLLLAKQGKTRAATEVFSRLAREYPDLPEPRNNLAVLYAARGEYEKARDALVRAINTNRSYATAQKNLREVYAKLAGIAYDKALRVPGRDGADPTKLALVGDLFSIVKVRSPGLKSPALAVAREKRPNAMAQKETPAAAAPAPARTPAPPAPEPIPKSEVLATVNAWAAAWSRQDVAGYLGFYSTRFSPPDGLSRSRWEVQRYQRIRVPRFIRVKVERARVEPARDGRARVTFLQVYRSSRYRDRVHKRLLLRRAGGGWKIDRESTRP